MYTLINKARNLITDYMDDSQHINSCFNNPPLLEDFIPVHHNDHERKNIIGKVTHWTGEYGTIDSDIYFDKDADIHFDLDAIYVGLKVHGTAIRNCDYEAWRVTELHLNNNNWLTGDIPESDQEKELEEDNSYINQDLNADPSIVIDKIVNLQQGIAYLHSNGSFSINEPFCTFKVMQGDWVKCQIKVNKCSSVTDDLPSHANEIVSIIPLRKKTIRAVVTSAQRDFFILNNEVHCPWSVLADVDISVGDKATIEIIESHQYKYNWRVIDYKPDVTLNPDESYEKKCCETNPKFRDENNDNVIIKLPNGTQEVNLQDWTNIEITIRNKSYNEITLNEVKFISLYKKCPVKLLNYFVQFEGANHRIPFTIGSGSEFNIILSCIGESPGYSKQKCQFTFDSFHCSKFIEINCSDNCYSKLDNGNGYSTSNERKFQNRICDNRQININQIIHGEKPFRAPMFLPTKMPSATIPKILWDVHEDKEALIAEYPVLKEPLTFDNYDKKFELLLHLEELELSRQMSQFDIGCTCFIPKGEYLALEVPGLSENRPSIMIGDFILASFPKVEYCAYDDQDIQYEGVVHEVRHSEILLKFHSTFHSSYAGEDYSIRFFFNRTYFRRCHFSISFVKNQLGSKVLFPNKIEIQLPQAIYVDTEQNNFYSSTPIKKYINDRAEDLTPKFDGRHAAKLTYLDTIQEVPEDSSSEMNKNTLIELNDQLYGAEQNDSETQAISQNCNSDLNNNLPIKKYASVSPLFLPRSVEAKFYIKKQLKPIINIPKKNLTKVKGYIMPKFPIIGSPNPKQTTTKHGNLKWINQQLNQEQKQAVKCILQGTIRPLPYIIFGPPGTGKTICLVEALLQIFTMVEHSRILVVTPSNSASDLIVERIAASNCLLHGDFVRLNAYQRNEESIPETIQKYCYKTSDIRQVIHHRIIVATASTAGFIHTLGLSNGHFTHLFIDEAGQMTEPECCVALGLVNSSSGQTIMAGDPMQLGPVLFSSKAKKYGLQQSLLERLIQTVLYQPEKYDTSGWMFEPRLVTQLVKNYRSHKDIIHIPSSLFYYSKLQAVAPSSLTDTLLNWRELPTEGIPILFHGIVSPCAQEGDSPSWLNPAEAFQVVRYAKSLLNHGISAIDIGIITPYRKQVSKIRTLFSTFNILEDIKVGSVEEFQGQEKQAIIISTVRSLSQYVEFDQQHNLGFVSCPKRFNVAITRAQALLIVIGNPHILMQDNCWKTFIEYCIEKEVYIGPELAS